MIPATVVVRVSECDGVYTASTDIGVVAQGESPYAAAYDATVLIANLRERMESEPQPWATWISFEFGNSSPNRPKP